MESASDLLSKLCRGLPLDPLPPSPPLHRDQSIPHAPVLHNPLSPAEEQRAVVNALRYFPECHHAVLAGEFAWELRTYGHIYMYRFKPAMPIKAYPLAAYPTNCTEAAAIMVMIMNNLDPEVAQFPDELVTYGGNGQVFSNWAQFLLVMKALAEMNREQTLVMYSGHPMGLFPSSPAAPILVITNGMVIPNYSSRREYDRMFALGVTIYGQMTAGSYCYIGPQGIVHGTTLTIMNAGRNHLKTGDLRGKVFVSSGLGGMSGAQAKAAVICGCVGVIAEVSLDAIRKRHSQGWLQEVFTDLEDLIHRIRQARSKKEVTSIGYHGNVVDVWERLADELDKTGDLLVELGSDQTSCHNPYSGGYFPVQLSMEESLEMIKTEPAKFKDLVQESLRRQSAAIGRLYERGLYFWDYGNAFLLEALRSGADVMGTGDCTGTRFKYPSYVQDIMGDIFSLGFGPFRWVCLSGEQTDLEETDRIAQDTLEDLMDNLSLPPKVVQQYEDNIRWIKEAGNHKLVVGSKARILYSDQRGRVQLALAFNRAVAQRILKGPVVLSRDHHDVSGTDSPFRETSNIYDGSAFTADMAVQNCIGDSFRGATWVALHNGGGVGWGEVINGGFGLLLDGSEEASDRAKSMLSWDVSNGVARRCWSGNVNAMETIKRAMEDDPLLKVTLPHAVVDQSIVQGALLPADQAL